MAAARQPLGPPQDPDAAGMGRCRCRRRPHQLCAEPRLDHLSGRPLHRPDPERGEASRSAGHRADPNRAGDQPEDRQGARPSNSAALARAGRQGHPMNRREFIAVIAGAAIALPRDARAQPKEVPMIGVLASIALTGGGLQQGLGEAGYIEGENLAVKYRVSNGLNEQLPAMAADLVRRKVGLIAAVGTEAARAAKSATSTIPIVFLSEDPVAEGLVTNLARPGGNLTGI